MKVTVKIDAKNLEGKLAELRGRLDDCTPGMIRVGDVIVKHTRAAFTNPAERPAEWPDLAESTLAKREAKIRRSRRKNKAAPILYGKKPLVDSGMLSRSPRVADADKSSVTVGSDRAANGHSLAAIHQFGTENGRIPARPFFPIEGNGFTAKVAKEIIDVFGKWLMRGK